MNLLDRFVPATSIYMYFTFIRAVLKIIGTPSLPIKICVLMNELSGDTDEGILYTAKYLTSYQNTLTLRALLLRIFRVYFY